MVLHLFIHSFSRIYSDKEEHHPMPLWHFCNFSAATNTTVKCYLLTYLLTYLLIM